MSSIGADSYDITRIMDESPITRLMMRVSLLCGAVALLVGSDTTSIGAAAPLIVKDFALSQAYLGPVFSAATAGMMFGALSFGPLADRLGRKRMLVVAVIIFSLFTIATALANTFQALLLARFLAGIGLGGAVPCFITLASEYAPRSHRAMITSLIWAAFPLGVILGAFLNAYLLAHYSWHLIFFIGGALPLVVCLMIVIWLPESVRFMLLRKPEAEQTRQLVSRILPMLPRNAQIVTDEKPSTVTPIASLFTDGRAAQTGLIWIAFLAAFGMTATTFYWSPVLLHDHGISLPTASLIVGVGGGIGSLIGAAGAGRLMEAFGATRILGLTFLLATFSTAVLGYAAGSVVLVSLVAIANGTLIAGLSTSGMLSLSATVYPVAMRSTGVGWAMAVGRFGEVMLPLLVAALLSLTGNLGVEVFIILAFVPLLGGLSMLLLGRRGVRQPRTAAVIMQHQ